MEIQTVLETLQEKYVNKEIFFYENINSNNYSFYTFQEHKSKSIKSTKCKGVIKDIEIDSDIDDYDYVLVIEYNDKKVYLKLSRN